LSGYFEAPVIAADKILLVNPTADTIADVENLASRCGDPVLGGDPGVPRLGRLAAIGCPTPSGVGFTSFVARQCQPELAP